MAYYIKVNKKVVDYLGLQKVRYQVADGNWLLWQADMAKFNPLTMITQTVAQIGGLLLKPSEARQEQDGTVIRELPTATDERFVIDNSTVTEETETEQEEEEGGESEEITEEDTGNADDVLQISTNKYKE